MCAIGVPGVLHVPITKSCKYKNYGMSKKPAIASVQTGFQIHFPKMPILAHFGAIFRVFWEWVRVGRGIVPCCRNHIPVLGSVVVIGGSWVFKCNPF